MKAGGESTAAKQRANSRRAAALPIEQVAGLLEVDRLGDLADEYAREIQRSPFWRPFDPAAAAPMPLVTLSLLSLGADLGSGWHPSHLLRDETLRQPPDLSVHFPRGLLGDAVTERHRARIEQQHRAALARQFIADRDAHPAYRRLRDIAGFRSTLEAFAAARDRSKPASTLRAPQAEAQLICCIVRPLWRLRAKDWREAPTKDTVRAAKKAAKFLIVAGKDGLHSLPSYYPAERHLQALLRELDAPTSRTRAPKLDEHTARRVTLERFDEMLAAAFGADAFEADLNGVRKSYADLIGFGNASDKVSPSP